MHHLPQYSGDRGEYFSSVIKHFYGNIQAKPIYNTSRIPIKLIPYNCKLYDYESLTHAISTPKPMLSQRKILNFIRVYGFDLE